MMTSFSSAKMQRLSGCLAKLAQHIKWQEVALTGGVAIELGLTAAGYSSGRASIADLDFVASCLDVVAESVSRQFLVSHYHVPQEGVPKFLIQLVDSESRIRVDVFPDLAGSLDRAR